MLAETVHELHEAMKHDFQVLAVLIGVCTLVILLNIWVRR